MVIYRITNLINGKIYIGQSTQPGEPGKLRWGQHRSAAKHAPRSSPIALAIKRYGHENFLFEIIDTASSKEELNTKEWFFASMSNSYVPMGYNLAECGGPRGRKHPLSVKKQAKTYRLVSLENEIIEVTNLSQFCRDNKLSHTHMSNVVTGKRYSCGIWRSANRQNKVYCLFNLETGVTVEIPDLRGFQKEIAKKVGISPTSVSNLIHGRIKKSMNWVLNGSFTIGEGDRWKQKDTKRKHSEDTIKRISSSLSGRRTFRLLNNLDGQIYEFTNIARFSKQMGLQEALVHSVLNNRGRSKHKGWSLPDHPIKRFLLLSPQDERIEVLDGTLKGFCREQGLRSPELFFKMLNGVTDSYKGWTLIKTFTLDSKSLPVIVLNQYDDGTSLTTPTNRGLLGSLQLART